MEISSHRLLEPSTDVIEGVMQKGQPKISKDNPPVQLFIFRFNWILSRVTKIKRIVKEEVRLEKDNSIEGEIRRPVVKKLWVRFSV